MTALPKVMPVIECDFTSDVKAIHAHQSWVKPGAEPKKTGIELPIAVGKTEFMPEGVAHNYVVNVMNWYATSMIADGYYPRPRRSPNADPVMTGFAKGDT